MSDYDGFSQPAAYSASGYGPPVAPGTYQAPTKPQSAVNARRLTDIDIAALVGTAVFVIGAICVVMAWALMSVNTGGKAPFDIRTWAVIGAMLLVAISVAELTEGYRLSRNSSGWRIFFGVIALIAAVLLVWLVPDTIGALHHTTSTLTGPAH